MLLGIVVGAIAASAAGIMTFEKMDQAAWFDIVLPFHFGMPRFDIMMILTMSLIMVVVMIESTGMFLALGSMTSREITQKDLAGACAPTAWARCWAASSTPSRTPASRRTWDWSR